ncbi:MAG: hypothetical protein L0G70_01150 [Rubrobacter sp.]|nr:hypothetical protein [Rubrobacter sp.]
MATKAIKNRAKRIERNAACKRAAESLARLESAVESMSDDELAAWWYGAQQHVERALKGDFEHFEEPARSGVRSWAESGAAESLKAFCDEYDYGPLPAKEAPGDEIVIPQGRVERVRTKNITLAAKHGDPVQRDPTHEAYVAG